MTHAEGSPLRVAILGSANGRVLRAAFAADAAEFLRKAGFRKIWNLKGGILAWSDEVDPSMPKY